MLPSEAGHLGGVLMGDGDVEVEVVEVVETLLLDVGEGAVLVIEDEVLVVDVERVDVVVVEVLSVEEVVDV